GWAGSRDRPAVGDKKARLVGIVVLDALGQDLQPVAAGGSCACDRGAADDHPLRDSPCGSGGVVKRDGLDLASFEEAPALQQRLRVGQSADNGLAPPEEAVADRVDDLSADPQPGALPQQVVDLL